MDLSTTYKRWVNPPYAILQGNNMHQTKKSLLEDIEKLIAYGREEPTINPALLEFLSIEDLSNTKAKLLERVGTLSEEDKDWLEQFKEYS